MNKVNRNFGQKASTFSQIVLIGVFFLTLSPCLSVADPVDRPQPQGRGVIKSDGEVEWKFGSGKSPEETGAQIPNQEDVPEFTPEQEKEAQDILNKVYSDPELGNVRRMFDEWAEQDRLEREGLLPKQEPKKLSALDEAYLRGQVLINGWIEFWRQFVPASIFPFPKEKDPALEKDPWENPEPDSPPKPAEDAPTTPSSGSEDPEFFKDPANNPWYSPDPPDASGSRGNSGGGKGLLDWFNDWFWGKGGESVPPSPGDTWNFLPEYKPGESVYENMPEMEEVKIDDAMPITDPVPLSIPENENKSSQVLINGSMPFDPGFGGSLGGVTEEPQEDFLEGLEMAMDSYGHVSVKINGQFIPIDQVTKEQADAERARQEAATMQEPATQEDAVRSGLETETDHHGNTSVKINGKSVNVKNVTKGDLKDEQNRQEAIKSGLETETDHHGNTYVRINGKNVNAKNVTKEQMKAEKKRLEDEKKKAEAGKTKTQSSTNQAPRSAGDMFGEADSLNGGTTSGSLGRSTPDARGIQFNRDLPAHEDSASGSEPD